MKSYFLIFYTAICLLTGCGFKLANMEKNYNISQIIINGDNKINYKLKNKILISSKKNNPNLVKLEIKTKLIKTIAEKNISNQINKYNINVIADVNYKLQNNGTEGYFSISKNSDYNVSTKYSETLNKEKSVINSLINNNELKKMLTLSFSDI